MHDGGGGGGGGGEEGQIRRFLGRFWSRRVEWQEGKMRRSTNQAGFSGRPTSHRIPSGNTRNMITHALGRIFNGFSTPGLMQC